MRRLTKTLGVVVISCACVAAMAGCSSQSTVVDNGMDNSALNVTSLDTTEPQEFETITFGTYEQDGDTGNGAEDIEWYVLDEQDGKTLLISVDVLDAMPYSEGTQDVNWENNNRATTQVEWADSSVREWLNGDFYETAFSSEEQSAIQTTTLTDTKMNNPTSGSDPEADSSNYYAEETEDNVFLLSRDEAREYFQSNTARTAFPTDYALEQGCLTGVTYQPDGSEVEEESGHAIWWLRTNGYYAGYAGVVADDGYIYGNGYYMNGERHDGVEHGTEGASEEGMNIGIRPCIWVDSSALE